MLPRLIMEPLKISPKYNIEHWKKINFSIEGDWQEAINIFVDRIQGRFLDLISRIESYTYAGFSVIALDCLLIETLQQFRKGVSETPRGNVKQYFKSFLIESSFGFCDKLADMFYDQIRNGILHQAEIKGTSRISINRDVPLVNLTEDGNGLLINRKLFHEQLVREFEDYVKKLRNPENHDLREKFKNKMNSICRLS